MLFEDSVFILAAALARGIGAIADKAGKAQECKRIRRSVARDDGPVDWMDFP